MSSTDVAISKKRWSEERCVEPVPRGNHSFFLTSATTYSVWPNGIIHRGTTAVGNYKTGKTK